MKYIEVDGEDLRKQFGSHFNIGFDGDIRKENLKEFNDKFDTNILSKILSDSLIFQYISYFPKSTYTVNETLGKAEKTSPILVEKPHWSIIEETVINNDALNASYDNSEDAKKALLSISNKSLLKIKEECTSFIERKNFSDIIGLNNKEKKEVKYFLDSLESQLNTNNIFVDYTTSRKLPESFPKVNDDFFIVDYTIQNPSIETIKVSDIQIYDINNKYSKEEMPFTIYLTSVNSGKEFSMTKEHFNRSNGVEFSVGMAGYTVFKNEDKAQGYLSSVLNRYSENIEKVQEKIKNASKIKNNL